MKDIKKSIIGSIILVILVLIVIYISMLSERSESEMTNPKQDGKPLEIIPIPESWKVYKTSKVNQALGGITFAHPPHWEIYSRSNGLGIRGDGYDISFHKAGTGLPPSMKPVQLGYEVGGFATKSWQREVNGHYEQVIVVNNFQFWIDTPSKSTELSDKVLSSITFE